MCQYLATRSIQELQDIPFDRSFACKLHNPLNKLIIEDLGYLAYE